MSTNMDIIYEVESSDEQGNKFTCNFFRENLAYAYSCPVFLLKDNDEKIEAEIAFSHSVANNDKGHSDFVYMVVSRQGGMITTEKGVKPARVRYRKIEVIAKPPQSENVEDTCNNHCNSVEKAAFEREDQLLDRSENNNVADVQIPQEITSNQIDNLSETLTEIPEASHSQDDVEINDEVANVPIKEEIRNDATPLTHVADVAQSTHPDRKNENSSTAVVSDDSCKRNILPKETESSFSSESLHVANKLLPITTYKRISRQVSQLSRDTNSADKEINMSVNLSAERTKTINLAITNEKEQSALFTNKRWIPPKQSPSNSSGTVLNTSTFVANEIQNVEETNVEDATVKKNKQFLRHIANMHVPQEIPSNQMGFLSETSTEIAESSQIKIEVVEINDEGANVPIKEKPKYDETPHNTVEVVAEARQRENEKERSCKTAISDTNSRPNSFPKENIPPRSAESLTVAKTSCLTYKRPSSCQEISQLSCETQADAGKIKSRNPTNNKPTMNELEHSTMVINKRWKPQQQLPSIISNTILNTSTSVAKTQNASITETRYTCQSKIELPLWLYRKECGRNELFGELTHELFAHLASFCTNIND